MEITEVKVFPVHEEKLKAFVSVVFDGCFMVNDIKIIHGREGLFISMPSRKKKNGEFKDVAHPLNNETRQSIESQILAEYERVLAERAERGESPALPPRRKASGARSLRRSSGAERPREHRSPSSPPPPDSLHSGAIDLPVAASRGQVGKPRPTSGALAPAEPAAAKEGESKESPRETTLEEVEERHLSDSFWTVT